MINELKLENFRNYENETVKFVPNVNILLGENGQGKTNILEGIYYLLTGKSYRVQREQELIRWGQKGFHIYGGFSVLKRSLFFESHYVDKRKVFKINSVPYSKLSNYVGTINVVFFSPDDLVLVKGGPSERRRFLDLHIAQMRPTHVTLLNDYNKALHQKNALLKSNNSNNMKLAQVQLWNEQLWQIGEKIIQNRWELTETLQGYAEGIYKNLSSKNEQIKISYIALGQKDLNLALKMFPLQLEEKMLQEVEKQMILVGPHRDDLQIMLNGRPARLYASQGQQRSIVLSLKLAELEIIFKDKGIFPLLLLDDVLSELDNIRREYLLSFINKSLTQTLITMTSADEPLVKTGAVFRVDQGNIRREN